MISLQYFNDTKFYFFYFLTMVNYLTTLYINFFFITLLITIGLLNNFYSNYKLIYKRLTLAFY